MSTFRLPTRFVRSACRMLSALMPLALAACGGGGDLADTLPGPLSPAAAATLLTSSATSYPAALAVRVSTTTSDVQVRGVRRAGGAVLDDTAYFPLGSMTKSMTATLAGVLVQEGRIGWTSKVLDVLPELGTTARPEYAGITLIDLLAHRGGLFPAVTPEQIALLPAVSGTPGAQRLQLTHWMFQRAPSSTPGARTQYSNGGYVVAASMLERVAGQAYETLLQAKVFAAIGATVRFGAPGHGTDEAWGHAAGGAGWQAVDPAGPGAEFPAFANPAGGAKLDGTALARYLQMHLRADRGLGGEILTPATARILHTLVQDGVALGWQDGSDLDGRALLWHNGSDDASYYGLMSLSREADAAVAIVVTGYRAASALDVSGPTVRMLRGTQPVSGR